MPMDLSGAVAACDQSSAKKNRLGTLFMDLDALSGVIAYKHTGESVTTVTAAVDRITINHPLEELCDLELSGQVTFATGRSSMEISLQVAKAPDEGAEVKKDDVLMTCAFTMVSLDPATKKPVAIAPLQIDTEEDRRLFNMGENNYNAKIELARTALRKQTPNDEESDLIHAMWLKQLDFHGKSFHDMILGSPPRCHMDSSVQVPQIEHNSNKPPQTPTTPPANPTTSSTWTAPASTPPK